MDEQQAYAALVREALKTLDICVLDIGLTNWQGGPRLFIVTDGVKANTRRVWFDPPSQTFRWNSNRCQGAARCIERIARSFNRSNRRG